MKSRRGVTMVELIISMAIMTVVFIMSFTMNWFGVRTFFTGRDEYDVQTDTRIVSDFITNEVRNISSISLSNPNDTSYDRIYADLGDNRVKYTSGGSTINKSGAIINASSDFTFNIVQENNRYFLEYFIKGTFDNQNQQLSSRVLLNNVRSATPGSGSNQVYYKTNLVISTPTTASTTLPPGFTTSTTTGTTTTTPTEQKFTVVFTVDKNNASYSFGPSGGTILQQGTVDGLSITISNLDSGVYAYSFTQGGGTVSDTVTLNISEYPSGEAAIGVKIKKD